MAKKSLGQLVKDWRKAKDHFDKLEKTAFPVIIGTEAVRVVRDNFRLQGYDDGQSVSRWPKRKGNTNKSYSRRYNGVKGSVVNADNKILEQTGALKNDIKYQIIGGKMVKIGVDTNVIPYAAIHNAGKMGLAWGKHPFRMPLRKYMPTDQEGPNRKILKAIEKKLDFEVRKGMQIFKR